MTTEIDITKVQALLKERNRVQELVNALTIELNELRESVEAAGEKTSGEGWNMLVRLFSFRTGFVALKTELIRLNTEIKASTHGGRLNLPTTWLLLVKLQSITDIMEPEDPAYDEVHDLFDWAENGYIKAAGYFAARDAAEVESNQDAEHNEGATE